MINTMSDSEYVASLMERARKAQKIAEGFTQEQVLELSQAIGWTTVLNAEAWAKLNYEETGLGNWESKYGTLLNRVKGVLRDHVTAKSVGICERDDAHGLIKIAKPVGVVGAICPLTGAAVTPILKAMNGIMGRNAVVFSAHPHGYKTTSTVVEAMREVLKKYDVPEDLLICSERPTHSASAEIMKQCDLIVATGSSSLVKAAYSSGTPAYGVGTGNVVGVIDETVDILDSAVKIVSSKTNDYAIGCSTENSIVVQTSIYDELMKALIDQKSHLCTPEEKAKIQSILWIPGTTTLNNNVICRSAYEIAQAAGIDLPEDTTVLLVEETGYGPEYPFSGDKLSPVLTVYRYEEFEDAIQLTLHIQEYKGAGHSVYIYSKNEDRIMEFAHRTHTSRVQVNQCQSRSNAGAWNNGIPFSTSMSCGTWGGNITTEPVNWKHYINITWVHRAVDTLKEPTDEYCFGSAMTDPRLNG